MPSALYTHKGGVRCINWGPVSASAGSPIAQYCGAMGRWCLAKVYLTDAPAAIKLVLIGLVVPVLMAFADREDRKQALD